MNWRANRCYLCDNMAEARLKRSNSIVVCGQCIVYFRLEFEPLGNGIDVASVATAPVCYDIYQEHGSAD
jgi:transcription elongation factor Elf1